MCSYCSDSQQIGKIMPQWLEHLLCSRLMKRKRRGCGTEDRHKYWLNFDACGMICASMVYGMVLFSDYVVVTHLLAPWYGASFWGFVHGTLFLSFSMLALLSHMRAMVSNPGAVPTESSPTDPGGWARRCTKCDNFKPERAHHCSICERCIVKMDHHCPWVNNCVGLANHKYFLLFLLYIFTIAIHALALIAVRSWECMNPSAARGVCTLGNPGSMALVMAVFLIAVLFSLFTCCLMMDQTSSVMTNKTQIDRWKERHGHGGPADSEDDPVAARRRTWDNIAEVVGGDPWHEGVQLHWFLPTAIVYPHPEMLTGFCFRETPRPRSVEEQEGV